MDARHRDVLVAVIREYVDSTEPVGSRVLAQRHFPNLSAATLRNVMAELEEAGYLVQPHTSAGRVPTDKGYRFYVDNLLQTTKLNKSDQEFIDQSIFQTDSHDSVMERISQTISQVTDNIGFVISPSLGNNLLRHIEFVHLGERMILVIIVSKSGLVQNRIIRVEEHFTQRDLDETARYVNQNFSGCSLRFIRNDVLRKMGEEKALYDRLLKNFILLCSRGLIDEVSELDVDIYLDGASNLISKPEFTDSMRMRSLFRTFEKKSKLVKILNECLHGKLG